MQCLNYKETSGIGGHAALFKNDSIMTDKKGPNEMFHVAETKKTQHRNAMCDLGLDLGSDKNQ